MPRALKNNMSYHLSRKSGRNYDLGSLLDRLLLLSYCQLFVYQNQISWIIPYPKGEEGLQKKNEKSRLNAEGEDVSTQRHD